MGAAIVIVIGIGLGPWAIHRSRWERARSARPVRILAPWAHATAPVGDPVPPSPYYAVGAYEEIRRALEGAATLLRSERADDAYAILTRPELGRRAGVVIETYPAGRVEGPPGSLDAAQAAALRRGLFDLTYPIGQPLQRGVRVGEVALLDGHTPPTPALMFARSEDAAAYARARVLVVMEAWIRVWQDVAGVRPISQSTDDYLAATGRRAGWSTTDLAVWRDLGIDVPAEVIDDPRFPEWRSFERWRTEQLLGLDLAADAHVATAPRGAR